MGLFVQKMVIAPMNSKYLVEQRYLPQIERKNVDLIVAPGTTAIINGVEYEGRSMPHKITYELLGVKKSQVCVYLYQKGKFDTISIDFFGGQHVVGISSLKAARGTFSIVGKAMVEVADKPALAKYFERSFTKQELVDEVLRNFRDHFRDEISSIVAKYITAQTTDVSLCADLPKVSEDLLRSRKTGIMLSEMGLLLTARGINMHLNPIGDTADRLKKVNDALTDNAIDMIGAEERNRELAAAREHEINVIRANNTGIRENTDTKNINTNGNATFKGNAKSDGTVKKEKRFCPKCGAEVKSNDAQFCAKCGNRL